MKVKLLILCLVFLNAASAQDVQIEEIQIKYSDGLEVFNICKANPNIKFIDKNEYYWYTEFSKIKSTKGGSGGNLLTGNYKFYDIDGNLRIDKNYSLGLEDGNQTVWDSNGNITAKRIFSKGIAVYRKFLNDEDCWIELDGEIFKEGTVRKVFTKYGILVNEEINLANNKQNVKIYYEDNRQQLKEEYTGFIWGMGHKIGKVTQYYKNGQIELDGQFHLEYYDIRIGKWIWYNEDGTIDSKNEYNSELLKWPNGNKKSLGGLIYDSDLDKWVRTGKWKFYDENGKYINNKSYSWGSEIDE
jgi:antitoxin component YwqK of YwqJK toxin-antitoxin module